MASRFFWHNNKKNGDVVAETQILFFYFAEINIVMWKTYAL